MLVGGRWSRIDRSGIELLNRPRHTEGCRVNRRRRRRRRIRPKENENCRLEGEGRGQTGVE